MRHRVRSNCIWIVLVLVLGACSSRAVPDNGAFPRRVLVTNDNGIDDVKLVELARAFAADPGVEVIVVAATHDRSGSSNFMGATGTGRYTVERRDLGPGIEAWALDGYPADCVIFALTGPLRERLPDVVVSGINGGPNLADDWFGSGTIGAARTAAYFGIPSIAVSGLDDSDPAAVAAVTSWLVRFVRSRIVASLEAPEYLTISFPVANPARIQGARFVERARGLIDGRSHRIEGDDSVAVWGIETTTNAGLAGAGTDVAAMAAGEIAIVPMRVDEYDSDLAARLQRRQGLIPAWTAADSGAHTNDLVCDGRLGVTISDAADPDGRDWGARIDAVHGSVADAAGLRVGDVVTTFNGSALASEPGDPVDPDDRFIRLLRALPCGSSVVLELVRDGEPVTARFIWDAKRN